MNLNQNDGHRIRMIEFYTDDGVVEVENSKGSIIESKYAAIETLKHTLGIHIFEIKSINYRKTPTSKKWISYNGVI